MINNKEMILGLLMGEANLCNVAVDCDQLLSFAYDH